MLSTSLRISFLFAILVYFIILFILLKRKSLSLRYTLLWLFSGFLMLIIIIFPQLLFAFSSLVGIEVQSNALFAVLFFCIIIILVSLTSIISKQNEMTKRLVQECARLEKRIRELEEIDNNIEQPK